MVGAVYVVLVMPLDIDFPIKQVSTLISFLYP